MGLGGSLPPTWGTLGGLPLLSTLALADNHLSGSLPDSWGTQLHLADMYLEGNSLQGTLDICSMSSVASFISTWWLISSTAQASQEHIASSCCTMQPGASHMPLQ